MKILLQLSLILICTNLYGYDYAKDILYYEEDTLLVQQIKLDSSFLQYLKTASINYKEGAHMKCLDGRRIWELRNDSLFLKRVLNCNGDELLNSDSNNVLCEKYGSDEVFATWLNAKVYNQYGKLLERMSGYSFYEFDREFEVKKGKLQQVIYYDNRATSNSIYHSNTDTLQAFLFQSINWGLIKTNKCELDKTIIVNFKVNNERKPEDLKVLRGVGENCDAEIMKAVSKIPDWNLYFSRGKAMDIRWNLPVNLSKLLANKKTK